MNLFELQKIFADSKMAMEQSFKILLDELLKQQKIIQSLQKQVEDKRISLPPSDPALKKEKDV